MIAAGSGADWVDGGGAGVGAVPVEVFTTDHPLA